MDSNLNSELNGMVYGCVCACVYCLCVVHMHMVGFFSTVETREKNSCWDLNTFELSL